MNSGFKIRNNAQCCSHGRVGRWLSIGAIWISDQYADTFGPGSHGTTFEISPSLFHAHAVLDILEKEDLITATKQKGKILHQKLSQFISKYPDLISEVRGRGLMLALAFKNDPGPLVKEFREAGLLVVGAGGHAIRFLPSQCQR